jgi:hypothetical protein
MNTESPTMRSQRRFSISGCCRKSALRAYHRPVSTLAQVCSEADRQQAQDHHQARPMFIAQNE